MQEGRQKDHPPFPNVGEITKIIHPTKYITLMLKYIVFRAIARVWAHVFDVVWAVLGDRETLGARRTLKWPQRVTVRKSPMARGESIGKAYMVNQP